MPKTNVCKMSVTISVNGRFWAFDLAEQLQKRGHLRRLITTYPYFVVRKWGIPRRQVVSLWPLEIFNRVIKKVPFLKCRHFLMLYQKVLFDRVSAWFVPKNTDLFIGWSSNSLFCLRQANKIGATTIVERGSSHMLDQLQLLQEEHGKHGIKFNPHHAQVTRRELTEYELANYIEVPSSFAQGTFIARGFDESKIIRSFLGVNLERFAEIPKKRSKFIIITAGALSLRKGSHYLIQAFFELSLPNAELWHLGGILPEMEPFIRMYDSANIIYHGRQPQADLHRFYSEGSVFCLPSIEEGFGMVIVQAMACGLPVICSTNTGGPDIINEGSEGFIVPIRSSEAIKEKILYMHDNRKECVEMGKRAKMKVESGFSWDDYGDYVVSIYQNLL